MKEVDKFEVLLVCCISLRVRYATDLIELRMNRQVKIEISLARSIDIGTHGGKAKKFIRIHHKK